ncbi:MAG: hypothetical protein D6731_19250 [Planctomycetota bacterium]|nr:MAG: hypothetical protein D6731_19250 [Planctomycetota bacterium]
MARARSFVLLALVLPLVACHRVHYVALEEAPLYAGPEGELRIATLPRFHHEPLAGRPRVVGDRLALPFEGQRGWVPRRAVRLVEALHPRWDGGEDEGRAVGHALRDAQVRAYGGDWDPVLREAVRRGQVRVGMTRRQVEVAWGWPLTVEPLSGGGGERWLYRSRREEILRGDVRDPTLGWGWSPGTGPFVPGPCGEPLPSLRPWAWSRPWAWDGLRAGWVELRLEVVEERAVVFGPDGRVRDLRVRRLLDDA